MRFVTYWIERAREDPEERIEKQRKHVTEVQDRAEGLKKRWAGEIQPNGYWTFNEVTGNVRQRLAHAEVHPVSAFSKALKDMDDKDRREASKASQK